MSLAVSRFGKASVVVLLCQLGGWPHAPAAENSGALRVPENIAPLATMLESVAQKYPGQVLKVELEPDEDASSAWAYEVKVLANEGRVLEIKMDAVSLEPFEVEGLPHGKRDD